MKDFRRLRMHGWMGMAMAILLFAAQATVYCEGCREFFLAGWGEPMRCSHATADARAEAAPSASPPAHSHGCSGCQQPAPAPPTDDGNGPCQCIKHIGVDVAESAQGNVALPTPALDAWAIANPIAAWSPVVAVRAFDCDHPPPIGPVCGARFSIWFGSWLN